MTSSIIWHRLDLPGHEIGKLVLRDDHRELSGTAIFTYERNPCKLDYLVVCDTGWRTRSARVTGVVGDREIDLSVSVDEEQRWRFNGDDCPAVSGCVDIDFGFSPSTNLLPVRRLSLKVGAAAEVKAAWLPFPSLTFEVLSQVYRRVGERTYQYESGDGTFVRVLEVNEAGFVTKYPGLWQAE